MFSFLINLTLLLVATVNIVQGGFVYPSNMKESTYIDSFFGSIPSDANDEDIKNLILKERARLKYQMTDNDEDESNESNKKLKKILKTFSKLIDVSQDKCDVETASDYIFLIDNQAAASFQEGPAERYLKSQATKQFLLCKPMWDQYFDAAIAVIDPQTQTYMDNFIDDLVLSRYWYELRQPVPEPPYSVSLFSDLVRSPPRLAPLLLMTRMTLIPLGQFEQWTFNDFRNSFSATALMFFNYVCQTLKPTAEVYKYAFNKKLGLENVSSIAASSNYEQARWLLVELISCKIADNFERPTGDALKDFVPGAYELYRNGVHVQNAIETLRQAQIIRRQQYESYQNQGNSGGGGMDFMLMAEAFEEF